MFRSLAPYVPPALTAAILGTLAVQEAEHLLPESMKMHLKPLLGRKREPPEDFSGEAAPQVGVFAGNDRAYSAVLVVQAENNAERKSFARSAAKASGKWNSKDVDIAVGFGPRVWEAVRGYVPLGNVAASTTDFKLKDRAGETSGKTITNTGGDLMIYVKADSQGKCVEVVKSVLKELEPISLSWSEDIYGFAEKIHDVPPTCPTSTSWLTSSAHMCKVACVPKVGSSYALIQRWEDIPASAFKGKARPISNHKERMKGFDQESNKLSIVKNTTRTGRLGSRANDDKEGMLFVGYSADPRIFDYMLDRMVGKRGGVEDTTLQVSKCIRAQQFYVPSQAQLNALANSH